MLKEPTEKVVAPRTSAAPKPFRQSPALDGVRALAILLVLGYHMASTSVRGGFIGVDVFFVLSGFLITTLLIRERTGTGGVSVRAFYARRVFRLLPALLVTIVLAVILASTFAPTDVAHSTLRGLPWVIFYASNFVEAGRVNLGLLGHTWSLAIEEQFYLVWPWLLLLVCRPKRRLRFVAAALAISAVLDMFWSAHLGGDRAYFSLDGHAMGLLGGAALAIVWNGTAEWRLTAATKRLLQFIAAVSVLGILLGGVLFTDAATPLAISVTTVLTVLLIPLLLGVPEGPIHRLFSSPPAVWIGKRSYGLYLYNQVIFFTFLALRPHSKLVAVTCLFATFAVAALSYKYVEQPFLRRKERFSTKPLSRLAVS
jgi:peptidoglycan/LPS O-acetylase OafA/YrhL